MLLAFWCILDIWQHNRASQKPLSLLWSLVTLAPLIRTLSQNQQGQTGPWLQCIQEQGRFWTLKEEPSPEFLVGAQDGQRS